MRGSPFGKACVDLVYHGTTVFFSALQAHNTITLDHAMKTALQSHPDLGGGVDPCAARGLLRILQGKTLPVGQSRNATKSSSAWELSSISSAFLVPRWVHFSSRKAMSCSLGGDAAGWSYVTELGCLKHVQQMWTSLVFPGYDFLLVHARSLTGFQFWGFSCDTLFFLLPLLR